MCADENIPSVNNTQNLVERLESRTRVSDQGEDIWAVQRQVNPEDDVLEAETEALNEIDLSRLPTRLLGQGRYLIPFDISVPEDYENIFEYSWLSRRRDRPLTAPDKMPDEVLCRMMLQWCLICLDDPSREADWRITRSKYIDNFEQLMELHIPARLDLKNWIAKVMFKAAAKNLGQEVDGEEFREWEPWMGRAGVVYKKVPGGSMVDFIPFFGDAKPGHLVWYREGGFTLPLGEARKRRKDHQVVRESLQHIETALVALAQRIARYTAFCLFYAYVQPESTRQGRPVLNREQFGRAIREILGAGWFDLPFDTSGGLRNWSEDDVLRPQGEMSEHYIFIGDDSFDDENENGD